MKYKYASNKLTQRWISPLMLAAMFALPNLASAQQGTWGNTTVGGNGQATLFNAHTFVAGGTGTQPGIIKTERSPIGILAYGPSATYTGANDANHVDGYVRKYGTAAFTFPIGNGTKLRPVRISAPASGDFKAAYWFANPNGALLPSGGPFTITSMGPGVTKVSNVEYWDVDGPSAVNLTLTWDAASAIGTLTTNQLSSLTIVGWNATASRWERITSAVDATSVLGGASSLTSGSITSTAGVTPDTYTAYTLAAGVPSVPDLTAAQIFSNTQLAIGQSIDYVVAVGNVGSYPTSAPFQFYFTNYLASSGLVVTQIFDPTIDVGGDVYDLSNGDFIFNVTGTRITLTSKTTPNVVLAPLEYKYIGFRITRNGGGAGAFNSTVTIVPGTGGGEAPTNNNTIANQLIKN